MPVHLFTLVAMLVVTVSPATRALAQTGPARPCAGLASAAFDLPEAPMQVKSAKVVAKETPLRMRDLFPGMAVYVKGVPTPETIDDLPEYCQVDAVVAPAGKFVLRMPTQTWNGKVLVVGCGGYCGTARNINWFESTEALRRGYAVTTSDMGHSNNPSNPNPAYNSDGSWAYHNLPAEIDFGYRATHVNTLAAKAIVAAFYGRPQTYAYFQGCSTGGRQGMMEAQRYPNDFNGIVAGAGPLYYSTSGFSLLWSTMANLDANNQPILKQAQVVLLHKAVMDSCDAKDGLKDGVITDPRACDFDPASLQCRAGQAADCLTAAQVEAVRKIYKGPLTSTGQRIHMGAPMPGSELGWIGEFVDDKGPTHWIGMSGDKFRYMSFYEDPGPDWQPKNIDWDAYAERARTMAPVYNPTNPDLRPFKAAGGKLIAYQGWNDQMVTPETAYDYYEAATRTMGGPKATLNFYRLFMLPGVNHCIGGAGASDIDYLTPLEDWVEKGRAPAALMGKHTEGAATTFSRPHYPYPDVATYSGHGDPNDAASFKAASPTR